jgi:hypothetical protein
MTAARTRVLPALALLLTVAACGAEPLSSLPVQQAAPEPSAAAGPVTAQPSVPAGTPRPSRSRVPGTTPTSVRPHTATSSSPAPPVTSSPPTCYGAVRHEIHLQETELDLITSMCFHTGGVLRLRNIGPGLVTATPTELVSPSYEAAVVDLRFVRPGTVEVAIPQDDRTHTITVVVIE